MKKILFCIFMTLMALNASANIISYGAKEKPSNDTTFRTATTTIVNGRSLIIERQKEGWRLYSANRLNDESVVITFYRLMKSKSATNSGMEDISDYSPDGIYTSLFRTNSGKRVKIEITLKDGKVVSCSSKDLPPQDSQPE